MKSEFSSSWKASRQPRKQRKYRHNARVHTRHRFLSTNLSKQLRGQYGKRNAPLRKGDEVLVMRGKFARKKAKVASIDLKASRIVLENINRQKKDGTKIKVFFDASNLQIQALNLDDRKRASSLNNKIKKQELKDAPNKELSE